ncbi:hypothetical protein A6A04_15975 [Paramagnetospirillum marisnigri]|uniref:Uncharacterized protein n=2 Tax=Paramagnetospirillum marisnigri TaxID=1285242 RepID=A0A178MR15_9PROT|nr:hypothetical protein A6A04_15975 [Paramagnetospirillum marisnigri]
MEGVMWPEFMTVWLGNRVAGRRGVRHIAMSALAISVMMVAGEALAKETACPQPTAPQSGAQPRAMSLKDVQALPNKPNPKVEGSVIVTEGYLVRAIAVRPSVSRCGAPVERSYQLRLLPKKPSFLKGRFSIRHAVVATVPARMVEGRVDADGAPIPLVGERVRLTGALTLAPSRWEQLNKTQGSLWELRAVTEVTPCPDGICPTAGQ